MTKEYISKHFKHESSLFNKQQ